MLQLSAHVKGKQQQQQPHRQFQAGNKADVLQLRQCAPSC
jgi:hypothetical protein